MRFGVSGQFQLQVDDGPSTPWFDNLITEAGLDQIGLGDYLTWCALGTGSTAPAPADTALATLLVTTNNLTSSSIEAGKHTVRFVFPAGTATGLLTEVGIGWDMTGTPLFSRAVLPEALEVNATQSLTVLYELTLTPPAVDEVYQITLTGGVLTTCTARAAYVGNAADWAWGLPGTKIEFALGPDSAPINYDGAIGLTTAFPAGTAAPCSSRVLADYVPGSHYLEMEGRWNLSIGNFPDGVDATLVCTNGYGAYQIGFDPPIVRTCYDSLKLTYRVSWDRVA